MPPSKKHTPPEQQPEAPADTSLPDLAAPEEAPAPSTDGGAAMVLGEPEADERAEELKAATAAVLEPDDPAHDRALAALVHLGVPEDLARIALAGHAPDSAEAVHAQAKAAGIISDKGAICAEHWPDGWDSVPAHLSGVGCEHGSWVR